MSNYEYLSLKRVVHPKHFNLAWFGEIDPVTNMSFSLFSRVIYQILKPRFNFFLSLSHSLLLYPSF